jgi:hypothetical protein
MFDHFTAPQMQRLDRENTERGNLRTAKAWLADQDARLAMTKPRPISRPVFIVELREFIAFCIFTGAGVGVLLAIGG